MRLTARPDGPYVASRAVSAKADLLVVAGVTIIAYLLSAQLELRELLTELSAPLERYQIDEMPFVVGSLAIAMAWFAWRRWRHADEELRLRLRAQLSLTQREQQYRALFMEDLAGNAVTSPDGTIQLCNPAMAAILGLQEMQEAIGRKMEDFYHDARLWKDHLTEVRNGRRVAVAALRLKGAGPHPVHVIGRIFAAEFPDGERGLHAYFVDISELQSIQRELGETLLENRLLSQKYLMAQEAERRNLSRELHDEMGQYLNAIKLDAVAIRDSVREAHPDLVVSANSIVELSGHVYEVVRGITQRLRPAALDALGLHDAVEHLVDQWQRRNRGIRYRFVAEGHFTALGEVVNITVYRLVQECLTNIAKHASANDVVVSLELTAPETLRVTVRDNGRGMDLSEKRTGLGLVGLRERVEALSGSLRISASPGQGVELVALLPLHNRERMQASYEAPGSLENGMVES